jgi:hypothetical protein
MNLRQAVEDYLPSKLSKILLGISLSLAGTPYLLPEFLIPEIQLQPKAQILVLKSLISLGLLLLGSLVILCVEINYRLREKTAAKNAQVFDQENGIWRDANNGLCYCPKCRNPLRTIDQGWHCVTCSLIHESAESIKKRRMRTKQESARVDAFNKGGPNSWMR